MKETLESIAVYVTCVIVAEVINAVSEETLGYRIIEKVEFDKNIARKSK
jgi:ABC-type nitrate/sulfonate/bicarbonate transport system permease component